MTIDPTADDTAAVATALAATANFLVDHPTLPVSTVSIHPWPDPISVHVGPDDIATLGPRVRVACGDQGPSPRRDSYPRGRRHQRARDAGVDGRGRARSGRAVTPASGAVRGVERTAVCRGLRTHLDVAFRLSPRCQASLILRIWSSLVMRMVGVQNGPAGGSGGAVLICR